MIPIEKSRPEILGTTFNRTCQNNQNSGVILRFASLTNRSEKGLNGLILCYA